MRIATYNVNGINGRLEILLRWLKEDKPDVVCLQELKSTTFPEKEISRAGHFVCHLQVSPSAPFRPSRDRRRQAHLGIHPDYRRRSGAYEEMFREHAIFPLRRAPVSLNLSVTKPDIHL